VGISRRELGGQKRGAEGGEIKRRGRGEWGAGIPPPQPTTGSGEHRKIPQRGPRQSPGRKRVLVPFEL